MYPIQIISKILRIINKKIKIAHISLDKVARAFIMKHHKPGGFKQQKFILSHHWSPQVQNQDVSRAVLPPRPWVECLLAFSWLLVVAGSTWCSLVFLDLQLHHSSNLYSVLTCCSCVVFTWPCLPH